MTKKNYLIFVPFHLLLILISFSYSTLHSVCTNWQSDTIQTEVEIYENSKKVLCTVNNPVNVLKILIPEA